MSEMLTWPSFLDIPIRESYDYQPADRRSKSDMEINSRFRVVFDTDETTLNCYFTLKLTQLMFYEPFEKYLLNQGSIWFKMPVMAGGFISMHTVRFRERPRMGEFNGGFANVTMVLDVAERNMLSEDDIWTLWELGGIDTFLYFEDLLQIIINKKYPVSMQIPPKPFVLPIPPTGFILQ